MGGCLALGGCQTAKDPVVVHMRGSEITLADLKNRMNDTPVDYQPYLVTPEGRRQFVDLLVREKVLLVEARKAGLQNDGTYRRSIEQFKTQWSRRLKDYEESLLVQSYLARLRSHELAISDTEVQHFFRDHQNEYQKPIEVQASHILLNSQDLAEKALARLKKGEPFESVAKEMSMDPATAPKGGALGFFKKGDFVQEFEQTAFSLKKGEISPIVKTKFGYHVIKKTDQRELPSQTWEQAKEEIQKRLQREKFDVWVSKAQSSLGVHVDDKLMAALPMPSTRSPQRSPQESLR